MRSGKRQQKQNAGAFDVRTVIAELIGFYGVVLVVVGLLDDDESLAGTGGIDANLWAGIGMIAVAAAFVLWSRLRPTVVEAPGADDEAPRPSH